MMPVGEFVKELAPRAHIIAASFYRGGEVIAAELTPEQREAYYEAENKAVDLINADFYKYADHVTAHAKGALQPQELLRAFVRYKIKILLTPY